MYSTQAFTNGVGLPHFHIMPLNMLALIVRSRGKVWGCIIRRRDVSDRVEQRSTAELWSKQHDHFCDYVLFQGYSA